VHPARPIQVTGADTAAWLRGNYLIIAAIVVAVVAVRRVGSGHHSQPTLVVAVPHTGRWPGDACEQETSSYSAWHEGGHVVAAWMVGNGFPSPVRAQLLAGLNGFTRFRSNPDDLLTCSQRWAHLVVLCAGRVGELMFAGEMTVGCSDDLYRARKCAQLLVAARAQIGTFVCTDVDALLERAHGEADALLRPSRASVEAIAEALLNAPQRCLNQHELEHLRLQLATVDDRPDVSARQVSDG